MIDLYFPKSFAFIFICVGTLFSIMNWGCLIQSLTQKRFVSVVPLIGGPLLALGLYRLFFKPLVFLAIFADYGTIVFISAIPKLLNNAWQTSRFRIEQKLTAKFNNALYTLNLFKSGVFIMKINFDPPQVFNENGAKIVFSGMQGKWEQDGETLKLTDYRENRETTFISTGNSTYLSKESNYPENEQHKYDCLDNIEFQIIQ